MENTQASFRIDGVIELLAPLSHIGETISTEAYLNEEPVIQPDGTVARVFVYNGNAWRGHLRDCMAQYMLDALGGLRVPLPAFHLLFSGGSIGGPQKVDLEQARAYRALLPCISLLGGGVGNQILPGKLRVGNSYPIVRQTTRLVPGRLQPEHLPDYAEWTCEKSFSRKDDGKDERLTPRIEPADATAPAKKTATDQPTQMRYTVELLCAGARLYTSIVGLDVSPVELGCLVSALCQFGQAPYLGGQSRMGHGLCRITYDWHDLGNNSGSDPTPFATVGPGGITLGSVASDALAEYDAFLAGLADQLADTGSGGLVQLLEATR